jgi:hypothetical protein
VKAALVKLFLLDCDQNQGVSRIETPWCTKQDAKNRIFGD